MSAAVAAPAWALPNGWAPTVAGGVAGDGGGLTGRVLVSLRAPTRRRAHAAAVLAVTARSGARLDGPTAPQIGMVTVVPPPGVSPAALVNRLRRTPGVRAASLEARLVPREVPDDPAMSTDETARGTPPATLLEWWALRENLPHAWDFTHADGALVAVIDSGIDAGHPEFAGRIDRTNDLDATPGDGPADTDQAGHGTHVAGLACAAAGDGLGLAGAGYGCHLIVEKSDFTDGSVAAAITDAADHGAVAINMSFGTSGPGPPPAALADAIRYAFARNVVLVSAAADTAVQEQGYPSDVLQPANTGPDVTQGIGLSVTSANFQDQRSSFAGLGSEISLAAYGSFYDSLIQGGPPGILSTFPGNHAALEGATVDPTNPSGPLVPPCQCRTTVGGDNRYAYLSGTSMAAPQVTAVAALVRHLNPDLTALDVVRLIKQTARRPPGGGWTPDLGWGILDAGAAIDAARTIDRRPPVSHLVAPRTTRRRVITLTWSGIDPAPPGLIASGIDHWEVYRSVRGGPAVRIATLPAAVTSLRVRVRPGQVYSWYTLAVDRAGNREVKHGADARTRVRPAGHGASARRAPSARRRASSQA